jgi:hypothetical protein
MLWCLKRVVHMVHCTYGTLYIWYIVHMVHCTYGTFYIWYILHMVHFTYGTLYSFTIGISVCDINKKV